MPKIYEILSKDVPLRWFGNVNLSKLIFANQLIQKTLKTIFSVFDFFFNPDSRFLNTAFVSWPNIVVSYCHNKECIKEEYIYSAFR